MKTLTEFTSPVLSALANKQRELNPRASVGAAKGGKAEKGSKGPKSGPGIKIMPKNPIAKVEAAASEVSEVAESNEAPEATEEVVVEVAESTEAAVEAAPAEQSADAPAEQSADAPVADAPLADAEPVAPATNDPRTQLMEFAKENHKIEGDKWTWMEGALAVVGGKTDRLKRVMVIQVQEKEVAPKGYVKSGDFYYLVEYYSAPAGQSRGNRDDRGANGGRDGGRGGRGGRDGKGGKGGRGGRGRPQGDRPQGDRPAFGGRPAAAAGEAGVNGERAPRGPKFPQRRAPRPDAGPAAPVKPTPEGQPRIVIQPKNKAAIVAATKAETPSSES